jgi:NAD(P)-dependent dehydrogenase (short-subunit alcohol dehydrogenase family)
MSQGQIRKTGLLEGQVAIVTGGTIGIGRAICFALAAEGACVVVVGRNRERLEQTVAELEQSAEPNDHIGLILDVRIESDMQEMAKRTLERFGRIDILIAAAGILRAGEGLLKTLPQMSTDEFNEVIDTNLKGTFLSNRAVLPTMINQRRGNILNISSTSGRKGLAFDSAYCASKFGIIGLTEALAEEMQQYGIRAQVLLPGAIETGMWDQNGPLPPPGVLLKPETVADFILYMVTLPEDSMMSAPVIEPFDVQLHSDWMNRSGFHQGNAVEAAVSKMAQVQVTEP